MLPESRRPPADRIQLCGTIVVEIGGRRVERALPGLKGRALFACLVVARGRPMSRDALVDAVWDENRPSDPDGTFATLLARLRAAVGRDRILGRSELELDLGADAWVDLEVAHASVPSAEAALATDDAPAALRIAAEALEIARRPLVPGVSTAWLEDQRRALDETTSALLEVGGRAALCLGGEHLPAAERSARELIARAPYRESGYALLMETHRERGNLAEAMRVYDDLRQLLREELGLSPGPSVRALAEQLLERKSAEPAAVRGVAGAPSERGAAAPLPRTMAELAALPFSGRRSELERLAGLVGGARGDRSRVLALSGDAGVGKTRLAAEVAARAHAEGCEVLHGRAHRTATTCYEPFVEALRRRLRHDDAFAGALVPVLGPELAELARLVPELRAVVAAAPDEGPGAAELRRQRVCDAVLALCESLAQQRPLVVVVEDLQWADESTLLLLRHIACATGGAPIALLTTMRDELPLPGSLQSVLLDLARERVLERLSLSELDEDATAELVAARCGDCSRDELRTIRAEAGGNPWLIEELLRSDSAAGLPAQLVAATERRLDGLSAAARDLLVLGAAAGSSFTVASLAEQAGASRSEVRELLRDPIGAGIVIASARRPDRYAFRHGLVRRALAA
jgi:DNA-binding SARP family transcriptional activator